jgi:hypothetical protein
VLTSIHLLPSFSFALPPFDIYSPAGWGPPTFTPHTKQKGATTVCVLPIIVSTGDRQFLATGACYIIQVRVRGVQRRRCLSGMAEECPLGGSELWLPDEFLDDDFFSEEEKAAVAAKSESDEEDGLSRGLPGPVRGDDAGHAGKVGFLCGALFWMVWSSRFAEH